jgi:hypothetical protein
MATYALPSGLRQPRSAVLRQIHNNITFSSPLSGYTQTGSLPGARWGWSIEWGAMSAVERGAVEGILTRLSGQEHRLQLWDFKRDRPQGTINLSGVTCGAAAQFATSLTLSNCGASKTLRAGDWLSVGTQLFMVVVDATADGSGVMTVEVRHPARGAISGGSSVTLIRPTALYILASPQLDFGREPGAALPPVAADFVEVFA